MLLSEKESTLRLISQFVFHDAQGMHQSLMGSRLIAVYSVCLEILPIVEETRSTRPGARRENASVFRRNLNRHRLNLCVLCSNGNASIRKGSHIAFS